MSDVGPKWSLRSSEVPSRFLHRRPVPRSGPVVTPPGTSVVNRGSSNLNVVEETWTREVDPDLKTTKGKRVHWNTSVVRFFGLFHSA